MSDLTASNCGCGCDNGCSNNGCFSLNGGSNSCSWIIILLLLFSCGGCGNGLSTNDGCGCSGGNSCSWIIILLLLFSCGGCGNGCGNNGCGC